MSHNDFFLKLITDSKRTMPYPMATYNAIVKESQDQPKILGRVLLNSLAKIPDGWTLVFRNTVIDKSTDVGKLIMCSSKEPLTIYKEYDSLKAKKILTGAKSSTSESSNEKNPIVTKLHKKTGLFRIGNMAPEIDNLVKSEMFTFPSFAKFSKDILTGFGVPTSYLWNAYGMGMNIVGDCPNLECDSKKQCMAERKIVYQSGYGEVTLTSEKYKFPCPVCEKLFPATNFLVCSGRSLFRYKVSEAVDSEVEMVVLESLGPRDEYAIFDNEDDDSLITYEFIEVTTVEPGSSFYYCIACDEHIEEEEDEIILGCGHPYHKSTCGANMTNCMVCEATQVDSILCLLTMSTAEGT